MRSTDAQACLILAEALKEKYVNPLETALRCAKKLTPEWQRQSTAELVKSLRRRLDLTQRQLAYLSGLPHSKVAKIEGGQDVQLKTLRQLFAGFGCGLAILPVCRFNAEQLWRRTSLLEEQRCIPRRQRYPRK